LDFDMTYTAEQEAFRSEVRTWLDEQLPPELRDGGKGLDPAEEYRLKRVLGRRLGARGWLYPYAPTEFGGGGLDVQTVIVLQEEMGRHGLGVPPYYDSGGWIGSATILVWGTDEQKERFLRPIYTGEVRTWQLLTEPEAGSDLASVKLSARRDGDDYVLNGSKIFVGSAHGADGFWIITNTDRDGERHENLSWFMMDATLPGITIQPLPVLADVAEGHKNTVFFDDVRVPADCLVGGENNGWRVANTHLQLEHGAVGSIKPDPLWKALLEHCRTTERNGRRLIDDPDVRDTMTEIHARLQSLRLLTIRNFWRGANGQTVPYNGPQVTYLRKVTGLWLTKAVHDVLGPAALTKDDVWGALDGAAEHQQREGIQNLMPGSTIDVQRIVISRALGIGRRADPKSGAKSGK
jgi:alkylation response protein AidB-like acyl-CoA dehydrogenase